MKNETTPKNEYKLYDHENCVIRLNPDGEMYRKFRGGNEHPTSMKDSNLAADAYRFGKKVDKDFYDSF